MNFQMDWTINIGHLLTLAALLAGTAGFIWNTRGVLQEHHANIQTSITKISTTMAIEADQTKERLDKMDKQMENIAVATIAVARQDERLKSFEHRLEKIEKSLSK